MLERNAERGRPQSSFPTGLGAEIPDLGRPLLEGGVVGDTALERHRLEGTLAGRLRGLDGSPPSRCSITSVVRLSALTFETPAT